MQKADLLIRTKLRMPGARQNRVARPRLWAQMAHGLGGPLTLIAAPAGFGKTTLAAECLSACGMPVAWLSLDPHDNQPGQFLAYLLAALQTAIPHIGGEAAQLLAGIQPAGIQPARPEAVLTSLINELDRSGQALVLVLDDYHLIHNPAIHQALAFLLDHPPACLHLVLLTRSDPPLPLARLRARGQLVELRAADLRFSEPEAAQFLNVVMGLQLEARAVAVLEARTEGWIAGLQMAALSMKDRQDIEGFIHGFSGTNRYILDYLLEEVLARQPAEIQHFLLHTAILERLNGPLCDALLVAEAPAGTAPAGEAPAGVTPVGSSAAILQRLERENLFVLALAEDTAGAAAWYRYHHLFADLLRARLQQAHPERLPALHLRAAAWFEQNGLIAETIRHLLAGQDIQRAAGLMEHYGPLAWAENDPSIVQMAASLPREILLGRPKLGLYLAWLLICQARIEAALPLLDELAHHLARNPQPGLAWVQTVILCAQSFLLPCGNPSGTANLPGALALDDIPLEEPILWDAAQVLYGMALARRGSLERAVQAALHGIEMAAQRAAPGKSADVPSPVPFLARIYLIQGRLHAAEALCREYLPPAGGRGARLINSPGSMEIVLGEALYEWNQLDEAEAFIRAGLRANAPWANIMTNCFGFTALVRLLQARGELPAARQALQELETRLHGTDRPREFEEPLRTLGVRLQLAEGDLPGAVRWAEQACHSPDFQRWPARYQLTLAHIRLAQQRYAEVADILSTPPDLPGLMNVITRQVEGHLLLALAAAAQGLPHALAHLQAGLALAEREGYLRVFLNLGPAVRELLLAYRRSGAAPHQAYAQQVLAAFGPARAGSSPGAAVEALLEPLSAREQEVLGWMALGKTNPEIARQLVVSTGTIKAHAASIYRKLDAANRTQAVARARQLGLLQ